MSKIDPVKLVEFMKEWTDEGVYEIYKPDVYKGMCILRDKITLAWREGKI